jgi:hypothetical protein
MADGQVASESHSFESGATRSEVASAYDLVPPEAMQRFAARYGMGAEKYGILNYLKGINDPAFVRQLISHMEAHLHDYKVNGSSVEDNLAAIMWGASTLMVVEKHNPTIIEDCILAPRRNAIKAALALPRPEQPLNKGSKS